MYSAAKLLMAFTNGNGWLLQRGFNPQDVPDVPYRTMRTMANHILKDILPEEKIIKVDLHEGSFPDFEFLTALKFLVYKIT